MKKNNIGVDIKTINHTLSKMKCPVSLKDVDLFSPGAQEHWYEAYEILHKEAPVHIIPGEGTTPKHDAFIISKHEDISKIVKDPERFPPGTIQPLKKMAEVSEKERLKMSMAVKHQKQWRQFTHTGFRRNAYC